MQSQFIRRLGLTTVALALVAGLAGCAGESERDLIASARALLEKKDEKTAIIQLKSALQQNPQSGEARFLLGDALLKSGDAGAAVVELEKARELKYGDDIVVPVLAKALMTSGQVKEVSEGLGSVTLADPKAAGSLKAAVAAAHIAQGQTEAGSKAIDDALRLDPKNSVSRLLKVRLTAGQGAFDDALSQVEGVIADDPQNAEAWNLKGELLWLGKSDADAAAQAFRMALSIEPRHLLAHSSLIKLLLQKKDLAAFKTEVASLKKDLPNHPETRFYEIQLALVEQDFARAREGAQQLLRLAPNNAYALQLAGAVEFQSGALLIAEAHLTKALAQVPGLPLARRLLAETYLRTGQPAKALSALQPLLGQPKPDAEALALAAESHLQSGDLAKSEHYYALAAKANPNDPKVRTALALSQISKGNAEAGFAQLESLASADPTTFADMALVSARIKRGDLDAALKDLDRLQAKMPGKALPHHLRGQVLIQRKDLVGARASFESALGADAAYVPAVAALAAIDVSEKKLSSALKRYEDLLARDPKNYRAMLAVADLKQRMGASPEEVSALLAEAVRSNAGEPSPRLAQIDQLLARRNFKAALSAAQDAASAFPGDPMMIEALGRAQLASGDTQQAISTFKKLTIAQPSQALPYLRLADVYIIGRDYTAAKQNLAKALEISPKLLVAQRALIQIALSGKRVDEAVQIARTVQKERPTEPVGFLMEGDIHMSQRAWDPAFVAFRAALDRGRSTEMAVRVHTSYTVAGRAADAERFAASWLKDHPGDSAFLFHLGSLAMEQKDYARAETRYREVLVLLPDNAASLNNIAWLLVKQGKPGAVPVAERANALLPDQSFILDTLALAYAAERQWPKAIESQRKAVERAPDVPAYRLSLAKLLIESGDRAGAKPELQKLEMLGSNFAGQSEVTSLLKSL